MASYFELLKHPNWQKRRLEILELANFECSHCSSKDKTLHVHHCYYQKRKKPWEYPDSALRCLCEDCHQEAQDAQLALGRVLSEVGCEDEVYGYALGALAFSEQDRSINVPSYEIASGVADYWGLDVENVLIPELRRDDADICGEALLELVAQHGSPSKPWLQRYARNRRQTQPPDARES